MKDYRSPQIVFDPSGKNKQNNNHELFILP